MGRERGTEAVAQLLGELPESDQLPAFAADGAEYTVGTKTSVLYAVSGFITGGTGRFQAVTTGTFAFLGGADLSKGTGFDTIAGNVYFAKPAQGMESEIVWLLPLISLCYYLVGMLFERRGVRSRKDPVVEISLE